MSTRLSVLAALAICLATACGEVANTTEGRAAYEANCLSCHGVGAVGGIGKNITFSTTAGIGNYTDADFLKALREGVNKNGKVMCDTMTRFTAGKLSDAKVSGIYGYLKTLKNDTVNKGSSCP